MIIKLSSENYQVAIDTLGAELKSFTDPSGREFIWNADPAYWNGSSPLLFPTIGNVRNGRTIIEGISREMPQHGFCKSSQFSVSGQSENEVTFSLTDSDATHPIYPYAFKLCLTYRLCGNHLQMTCQVFNRDSRTMYYHIGAHPGFMCPLEEGEAFTDYILEFEKDEHLNATVYDLKNCCFSSGTHRLYAEKGRTISLAPELFNDDAIFFEHTDSNVVRLLNPASGKGVAVDYTDFVSVAFWTPLGGAPFLCVEPWNGSAIYDDEDDIFTHKRNIQSLEPGADAVYELGISLIGY
ncbi:MAG: aldose 1-epimerase family protein [Clostridiales bacterium]|nr:aldose 1-epimerase family protein [Clostridiales bacterium]